MSDDPYASKVIYRLCAIPGTIKIFNLSLKAKWFGWHRNGLSVQIQTSRKYIPDKEKGFPESEESKGGERMQAQDLFRFAW